MLVLVFLLLLLSVLGVTFRRIATALRLEADHAQRTYPREVTLRAAAAALAQIEEKWPNLPSNPFTVTVPVDPENATGTQWTYQAQVTSVNGAYQVDVSLIQ
jgi:hypothetical protein